MGELTDWATLKQRCADNACNLILRMETLEDGAYLSLSAVEKKTAGKMLYDIRDSLGENAPQYVVTQAVNRALAEWWT